MAKTLFDKIWEKHEVAQLEDGTSILYIDLHLVHEVTSPQAFEGLRLAGRSVGRPDLTFATMDHNVPTDPSRTITDPIAKTQVEALEQNCAEFGVTLYGMDSDQQGIVHVIGPELGLTLPGKTIVCGDSHTSTHGAFGALAFGIGTSEVEHVLATQCLHQRRPKNFKVEFAGPLSPRVTSKDMILKLIAEIGTAGGTGSVLEYTGEAIRDMSMEARMTICNMSIEAGARAGLIAPDATTVDYIKAQERSFAPRGEDLEQSIARWRELPSDEGASYQRTVKIDAAQLSPQVSWGTSPGMTVGVADTVPVPGSTPTISKEDAERALAYMDLKAGMPMTEIPLDVVFIGSCTNARIEDLRAAAEIFKGQKVDPKVRAMIVPGSFSVKHQAEAEGLHDIFQAAGAEWREPGCSMCLAMNADVLEPGQRCASTSNRNFEGRQGKGGRTHLVSPQMAAVAAIAGHFVDIREWN